ncbi:MAG: peptidyl-prolyl cis-trans isomerase B (cyclophilin B) [Gammaproteobacteria bacterium]
MSINFFNTKNISRISASLLLVFVSLFAVADEHAPTAVIETKFGDIELRLFPGDAPKHVENFLTLAKSGFYDGTIFHRIIPGFMIQGGDPNTKGTDKSLYGTGGPDHSVPAEFNKRPHKRGILSMARSQDPNSAGSQFFIVVQDSNFLDGQYTVFGEVTKGMEIADKIVSQKRDGRDNPEVRIPMNVIVVEAETAE